MAEKQIHSGWLKSYDGTDFAPITVSTLVKNPDGTSIPTRNNICVEIVDTDTPPAYDYINGDVLVKKITIQDDKQQYTAYTYSDGNWVAMDGNYDAENIYFAENIPITTAVGYIELENGSGTIPAKGKNLKQVFESIWTKELEPTVTLPAVTISTAHQSKEVGTVVTPSYSASLSTGSYTYGPATGITAQSWSVTCGDQTLTTASGDFNDLTITEGACCNVVAAAAYNAGAIPVTNLGNACADKQIVANSASASKNLFTGYRNGYFYGVLATDSTTPLTSDIIRSGTKKNAAYAAGNLPLISASSVNNRKRIFVACPATKTGVTKVIMPSAMNADCTADFVKQSSTITVEGADGYTGIAYNVWVYEPAAISDDQTFTVTLG